MSEPLRVVFDCNVLLQALASPRGPSGECFDRVVRGEAILFISPVVLAELRDVASRPTVAKKLHLTSDRVAEFIETVTVIGTSLDGFPETFLYDRDPKDAHYVNLALAADARLIVSRDQDLLALMRREDEQAIELLTRHPDFRVLTPVELLSVIDTEK